MISVRSIDDLLGHGPALLDTDSLRSLFDHLIVAERRVAAAKLATLAELNRRNTWRADGAGTAEDWAAAKLGCFP